MGRLRFQEKKHHNILLNSIFVACDFRELHKKPELKIVKTQHVRACPKERATQIWSLKILGINSKC
jgi:hypothetical protein